MKFGSGFRWFSCLFVFSLSRTDLESSVSSKIVDLVCMGLNPSFIIKAGEHINLLSTEYLCLANTYQDACWVWLVLRNICTVVKVAMYLDDNASGDCESFTLAGEYLKSMGGVV